MLPADAGPVARVAEPVVRELRDGAHGRGLLVRRERRAVVLRLERAELGVVRLGESPCAFSRATLADLPVLRDLPELDVVDARGVPRARHTGAQPLVDGAAALDDEHRSVAHDARGRGPGPRLDVDAGQVLQALLGLAAQAGGFGAVAGALGVAEAGVDGAQ